MLNIHNSEILIPIICFYIEEKGIDDLDTAIKELRKDLKEYRKEMRS